jgi:hypothetical protein
MAAKNKFDYLNGEMYLGMETKMLPNREVISFAACSLLQIIDFSWAFNKLNKI